MKGTFQRLLALADKAFMVGSVAIYVVGVPIMIWWLYSATSETMPDAWPAYLVMIVAYIFVLWLLYKKLRG